MENEKTDASMEQLKSASKKALWMFALLNLSVILLFVLGEKVMPVVMLLFQSAVIVFGLVPALIYQVAVKKQSSKLAFYKALASYREFFRQVSW